MGGGQVGAGGLLSCGRHAPLHAAPPGHCSEHRRRLPCQLSAPQKPSQASSMNASRRLMANACTSGTALMPCFLNWRSPKARDTSMRPAVRGVRGAGFVAGQVWHLSLHVVHGRAATICNYTRCLGFVTVCFPAVRTRQPSIAAHKAARALDALTFLGENRLVLPGQRDGLERLLLCLLWLSPLLLLLRPLLLGADSCCRLLLPRLMPQRLCRPHARCSRSRRSRRRSRGGCRPPRQHTACIPHVGDNHGIRKHPSCYCGAAVGPALVCALLQHTTVQLAEALCYGRLARFDARLHLLLVAAAGCCCCCCYSLRLLLQACCQAGGVEVCCNEFGNASPAVAVEDAKEGEAAAAGFNIAGLQVDHCYICECETAAE